MSDATLELYAEILQRESRGPGDYENAMRRIESHYGLGYWTQWGLRHKKPKDIRESLISKVRTIYLKVVEKSVRRDLMRLENEVLKGGHDAALESLEAKALDVLDLIRRSKNP